LEALACGTPVIATAVGGIPEQVKSLGNSDIAMSNWQSFGVDEATGVLVKPADAGAMAGAIERLLKNGNLRCRLAENAANDARQRFDQKREVMEYLDWYQEIEDSATR
jgi:glycosyltransferase involved in cell wall biosynthesis